MLRAMFAATFLSSICLSNTFADIQRIDDAANVNAIDSLVLNRIQEDDSRRTSPWSQYHQILEFAQRAVVAETEE